MSLSFSMHSGYGWKAATDYDFARRVLVVPLSVNEITRAARFLPIVFGNCSGRWIACCLLGIEGTNVCVSQKGQWLAGYVPGLLRAYPFCLDGNGELGLWPGVQPESLESRGVQPFFDEDELAPRLKQTQRFLEVLHADVGSADPAIALLHKAGALTVWAKEEIEESACLGYPVQQLVTLDPSRFLTLDDNAVLKLFRSDAMRWLTAQIESMAHIDRLKKLAGAGVGGDVARSGNRRGADVLAAIAEEMSVDHS